MGIGSRALFERAQEQSNFIGAVNTLAPGRMVPVPGGVLIQDDGVLLGAIGVSGDSSDNDENRRRRRHRGDGVTGKYRIAGPGTPAESNDVDPNATYSMKTVEHMIWPYDDQGRLIGEDVWE